MTYRTSRPSADQTGRPLDVSEKVIRENGPDGSCLTQMSRRPSRVSVTAIAFPSGDRLSDPMTPCGSHPESTGVTRPSRLTHAARREPRVPPEVYARDRKSV